MRKTERFSVDNYKYELSYNINKEHKNEKNSGVLKIITQKKFQYRFLDENLQYKRRKEKLIYRFKYRPKRVTETNNRDKWSIVTCTRNSIPFYFDRKINLRLNVVFSKYNFTKYLEELDKFKKFNDHEFIDRDHNSKLILKDPHIKLIVLNADIDEQKMWISQSRKSKVISSFTVPSDKILSFSEK